MKKLLIAVAIMMMLVTVTGCAPSGGEEGAAETSTPGGPGTAIGEVGVSAASPTPIVLATPTSKPTPTLSLPTDTPEVQTSEAGPKVEATPEPEGPAVTDVMITIPEGCFIMGSDEADPEDAPAHEECLPEFEIDKFEVTKADFDVFVKETGYVTFAETQKGYKSWRDEWGEGEENHPVNMVVWGDAVAYCEWLGKRLPTEAEWEKAARGDDGRVFPWGNEWDPNKANVKESGLYRTNDVRGFDVGASPYGVLNMAGNVGEWTADWYQAYPGNTMGDSAYGEVCRVTRGGSFFDVEPQVTTFTRNCAVPDKTAIDELGFRCAR